MYISLSLSIYASFNSPPGLALTSYSKWLRFVWTCDRWCFLWNVSHLRARRQSQRLRRRSPRVLSWRARGMAAHEAGEATGGHPQRSKCVVHRVLRRGSCATIPAVSVHSLHKSAGVHRPFRCTMYGAVTTPPPHIPPPPSPTHPGTHADFFCV